MKLDKKIKKKLLETKEQKDRLITEQEIVRSRIMMIFESQENIENWENLSEEKKFKISLTFQNLLPIYIKEKYSVDDSQNIKWLLNSLIII